MQQLRCRRSKSKRRGKLNREEGIRFGGQPRPCGGLPAAACRCRRATVARCHGRTHFTSRSPERLRALQTVARQAWSASTHTMLLLHPIVRGVHTGAVEGAADVRLDGEAVDTAAAGLSWAAGDPPHSRNCRRPFRRPAHGRQGTGRRGSGDKPVRGRSCDSVWSTPPGPLRQLHQPETA